MARPRDPAKWDVLDLKYRARLERNGLTRAGYARGDSLKSARGHKPDKTPEHPQDFLKNPGKYQGSSYRPRTTPKGYESAKPGTSATPERGRLENEVIRKLDPILTERAMISGHEYSPELVRDNVHRMPYDLLIFALTAGIGELLDAGEYQKRSDIPAKDRWLWPSSYGKINPLWYHAG